MYAVDGFFKSGFGGYVDFASYDRFDAVLHTKVIELDRAEHVPMVGDRACGHLVVFDLFDERF